MTATCPCGRQAAGSAGPLDLLDAAASAHHPDAVGFASIFPNTASAT
jgi:hypothetical protein